MQRIDLNLSLIMYKTPIYEIEQVTFKRKIHCINFLFI